MRLIDITFKITPQMIESAGENEKKSFSGHLGTHFDVMDKEFPLNYTELPAVVFDVSSIKDRDISSADIELSKVSNNMFVAFYTGFIEEEGYGSSKYFTEHPQLSDELIDALLEKKISIIGIDFAGVRRGKEHTPKDAYCADKGIFIIENLFNLQKVIETSNGLFTACTYPINFSGMTGLPCRVIAKV